MPSYSPFCMKAIAMLQLVGVPHRLVFPSGPPKGRTGKLPVLLLDGGRQVEGSDAIVDWLREERGLDADSGLTPHDRAVALTARRTLEEHLYFAIIRERWLEDRGFAVVRRDYFAGLPAVLRSIVPPILRRRVRRDAHGQGLSRMDPDRLQRRIDEDLDSLAALLGDRPWYLADRPTQLDAVSWAFLGNALAAPMGGRVAAAVQARPTLVAHCTRFATTVMDD